MVDLILSVLPSQGWKVNKYITWIKNHKVLLISILINIILCLCLMSNCKGGTPGVETKYITKVDTVTVVEERIVEHTKVKYVNYVDTFYIKDRDTVFLEVPIEYKQYSDVIKKDSTETKINIDYHGFAAGIDNISLEHKYNKEILTITQPPKKWGVGLCFGPYIGFGGHANIQQGTFGYGPEIGVGISVGLVRNFLIGK